MTVENYGKIWCLDQCYPLSKTNLSNGYDMEKCLNWINLRPMYVIGNIIKGDKIDHRLYLLQQIKANKYLTLKDQEGINEKLHQ